MQLVEVGDVIIVGLWAVIAVLQLNVLVVACSSVLDSTFAEVVHHLIWTPLVVCAHVGAGELLISFIIIVPTLSYWNCVTHRRGMWCRHLDT